MNANKFQNDKNENDDNPIEYYNGGSSNRLEWNDK